MANLARKPGDLRDMAPGPYTLSVLIGIIEKWDEIEEKDAGLSGINGNYAMLGMMGVPTFFISLLHEIALLKEEQAALLQIGSKELDEQGEKTRRALVAKHTRKIRDLVCILRYAALRWIQKLINCVSRNAGYSSPDQADLPFLLS